MEDGAAAGERHPPSLTSRSVRVAPFDLGDHLDFSDAVPSITFGIHTCPELEDLIGVLKL